MPEAWRIVKAKHAATAFSGKGAADHGGRWNSRGVAVVYASRTKSLAVLESLVHLNPPVRFKSVAFRLEFDGACVETFPLNKLPLDWQVEPPPRDRPVRGGVEPRRPRHPPRHRGGLTPCP